MDIRACLFNACYPMEAATKDQYVDCSEARGSDTLAEEFLSRLAIANKHLHFLFTGHIGCGKSSELRCLEAKLLQGALPNGKKYLPVFLDAQEYLDVYDVEPVDLLLAIMSEMTEQFEKITQISLEEHYIWRKWEELKTLLGRDVDIDETEISAAEAIKIKLKLLPSDPTRRQEVRDVLRKRTTTLHYEMNLLFDRARRELQKKGYTDFVLILDSLDRIQRVGDKGEGQESHYEFFIERAPQLHQMEAHIIFTLPLALARLYSGQLMGLYGEDPFVLPMIKIRERDGITEYAKGIEKLEQIFRQRVQVCGENGVVPTLDEVVTPDALARLISSCGGHVRHLMHFTQQACASTRTLPLTREAVVKGMGRYINNMSTSVRPGWWEKLAKLHVSESKEVDLTDEDVRLMLEQNMMLEFRNGIQFNHSENKEDTEITHDSAWYGVHPVLQRFPQFKDAVTALSASSGG